MYVHVISGYIILCKLICMIWYVIVLYTLIEIDIHVLYIKIISSFLEKLKIMKLHVT